MYECHVFMLCDITITLSPARLAHSLGSLGTLKEQLGLSGHMSVGLKTPEFWCNMEAKVAAKGVVEIVEISELWLFKCRGLIHSSCYPGSKRCAAKVYGG